MPRVNFGPKFAEYLIKRGWRLTTPKEQVPAFWRNGDYGPARFDTACAVAATFKREAQLISVQRLNG